MAFIDNGAGNSMTYGADRPGAYNAFMPSLGGCEAYNEDADITCKGCETVNPEFVSVDHRHVKCAVCGELRLKD